MKGRRKKGEITKRERMTRERDIRIKGRGRGILDEYKNATAVLQAFSFILSSKLETEVSCRERVLIW